MTDRGLPTVDGASACPFVAFEDARDDRSDRPDPRHRCYAESPPTPRARAHQETYCLSPSFPVCPTFQDWARREAARVTPSASAESPAVRLRDVPAQREAGERPPSFAAPAAEGTGPGGSRAVPGTPGAADLSRRPAAPGPPVVPAAPAAPGSTSPAGGEAPPDDMLDRVIMARGGADPPPAAAPWDLPPRRSHQPGWSAPPPWAANPKGSQRPGDDDAPAFLRPPETPGDQRIWGSRPAEEQGYRVGVPYETGDPRGLSADAEEAASEREATIARLRALGMTNDDDDSEADSGPAAVPRPVPGVAQSVDPTGKAVGAGRASRADAIAASGAAGQIGSAAAGEIGSPAAGEIGSAGYAGAEGSPRPSSALARLLGWDRRPRAGAGRPPRRTEREPAWERPRRFEAYPTLRTRVGLPTPSRPAIAAGALVLAALVLFFVPPLFLHQGAGTGPGASGSPGASGVSASTRASVAPTRIPSPTPKTYTVRSGDTLSTIAKRFGLTVEEILAANKNIKNPNKIAIGDVIVIPSAAPSEILDGGASASP